MRRIRSIFGGLLLFILFCGIYHSTELHAHGSGTKEARIVDSPIFINGVLINNVNSTYPLLTYHDIVYIPLTWNYSRWMGLSVQWEERAGLTISRSGQMNSYVADENTIQDMTRPVPIALPDYPVFVNGKAVAQDADEDWPLFNANGVTYFPLTWSFAVEEFGWNYNWSEEEGLQITAPGGHGDEQASIRTALHQVLFHPLYSYTVSADYTDLATGEHEQYQGVLSHVSNEEHSYQTIIHFDEPVPFSYAEITSVGLSYRERNPSLFNSRSIGYQFTESGPHVSARAIGPALHTASSVKTMLELLQLHFFGNLSEWSDDWRELGDDPDGSNWELRADERVIIVSLARDHSVRRIEVRHGDWLYHFDIKPITSERG